MPQKQQEVLQEQKDYKTELNQRDQQFEKEKLSHGSKTKGKSADRGKGEEAHLLITCKGKWGNKNLSKF